RTPRARPQRERREPDETADRIVPSERIGWSDIPHRLRLALLLAVLGAGCTVLGLALGPVRPAVAPGFSALALLVVLAWLPGLLVVGAAGAQPGSAYAEEFDSWNGTPGRGSRRVLIGWALACATICTAGLLLPAFYSHDAFQLTPEVAVGPMLVIAGGLLVMA